MQGRGLKQANTYEDFVANFVAPYAGAWIETSSDATVTGSSSSPLMQGR